jgi:hypothetical protein
VVTRTRCMLATLADKQLRAARISPPFALSAKLT